MATNTIRIACEGGVASGKTTALTLITRALMRAGYSVEPGPDDHTIEASWDEAFRRHLPQERPSEYGCLGKAEPDEPVFVLLARDASAPAAVLAWAIARLEAVRAGRRPKADLPQIGEALRLIAQMVRWRLAHPPAVSLWDEPAPDRELADRLINRLDEITTWL